MSPRTPTDGLRALAAILVAVLALAGSACERAKGRLVASQDEIILERRPDPVYDQLYPYYVELCAVSQFRSKVTGAGGVPGHAVMYLKGACNDEASPYPQLRRCRRVATDPYDPEHGAGVSVNRWFRNVNWIATPGQALFYEGGLSPDARLTRAQFDATIRKLIDAGVYRGVELHEYPTDAAERSLEDFIGRQSLATDHALRFARSVFCARMPVTESMLGEVIDFLNELNHEFATGEADYQWSGLSDNCVHTLRNSLAAASIWTPTSVRVIKLRQIFNLAIPANEFVNLARLGAEGPLEDYGQVYDARVHRDALMEFDWLPTRHGALVKTLPVFAENDLYDTTLRLFVLQSPFRRGQMQHAVRLLSDERFVDVRANLRHFEQVYARILAERDDEGFGIASLRGDRYRRVRRRYYAYIEKQQAEMHDLLARLGPESPQSR
jgi:hypothetical protein